MKDKQAKETRRAGIDPALAERARAGDRAAFTSLYEQTSAELYRSVRAMVRDEDLAWDILQDSYLRAWRGLDKLDAGEAFLPWLRRIAVNVTATKLGQRQPLCFSELAGDEDEGEPEVPDPSPLIQPELALDRKESSRLVREILAGLPEEQQLIVGMRYYEDMPVKEIAEALGVAPGTVKAQLFKGRKKIEAGVRALEKQGVKLYGLSPLPFLLALLGRLEPAAEAEKQALNAVLTQAPAASAAAGGTAAGTAGAAAGTSAVTVTAMTAGQAFLHGLGAKLLAGALALALLVGGGKLVYDALQKGEAPRIGDVQETVSLPKLETSPTEHGPSVDSPESLTVPSTDPQLTEPETTEPPAEPRILASGHFGLRQREEQSKPVEGAALPYFTAIDTDTEDQLFTNNAVEIRYDGSGVRQRALPDGEEQLLFSLERTPTANCHLIGVTDNRLYFSSNDLEDVLYWWGVSVFSLNYQGGDRQELGSGWNCYFFDGWVALLSFHSDMSASRALIFNRDDELVFEAPEERVWDVSPIDGSLYLICVVEQPKEGEEGGERQRCEDLIRLDSNGTQTVLLQVPVVASHAEGYYASISNGVISIFIENSDGSTSEGLYDLYTLEPLEDRFDSSLYDDSLTWTLDDTGLLTISGSGVMGDCSFQPWDTYGQEITAVVLQDGVPNIGSYAFSCCTSLTSVSIPDSVTSIGDSAFFRCDILTSVTVPDSVTHLGSSAFSNCWLLTDVTLPAGLTEISSMLFCDCLSLERVDIPASVTSIGEKAFWLCSRLKAVTVPESVTSIGARAFGWDYDDASAEEKPVVGFTVCGAAGSAAQRYAEENGFIFVRTD